MALDFIENPSLESQMRSIKNGESSNPSIQGSSIQYGDNNSENYNETAANEIYDTENYVSNLRKRNLPAGANPTPLPFVTARWKATGAPDWRVKLSIPSGVGFGALHGSLARTGGMMFPYTPNITFGTGADYSEMTPTHALYPYVVYQNSRVTDISISGTFTCQNTEEATYIIAAQHYFSTMTKSAYAGSANQGSPPPIVFLNGYGQYMFQNVPVVVGSWNINLPADPDYIQAATGTYAPTKCEISCTLKVAYSRSKTQTFSLQSFAAGKGGGFV